MQVSVEKTSELSRKMTVNVPETVVQEKMAERLKVLGARSQNSWFSSRKSASTCRQQNVWRQGAW